MMTSIAGSGEGCGMDLRVLVLTRDLGLAELVRTQVENLGAAVNLRGSYDEAGASLDWADAAVIDLAGSGLDDLNRLRVEAPRLRVLAIATDDVQEGSARSAGADEVLVEPFTIADIIDAVRHLAPAPSGDATVIDLATGEATAAPAAADAPWWATRTH
jgi:DNA-binding response OmpR family regulator